MIRKTSGWIAVIGEVCPGKRVSLREIPKNSDPLEGTGEGETREVISGDHDKKQNNVRIVEIYKEIVVTWGEKMRGMIKSTCYLSEPGRDTARKTGMARKKKKTINCR